MGRHARKKPETSKIPTKEKLKLIKKEKKQKLKQKRARLIIRNLPFQADEENLKNHFEKFGEIEDVKVLKKEDGKLVGCGFVQFKLVQKAAKARHHLNGKPFLGRDISVDFALAKSKYETKKEDEVKIKEEPIDPDDIEIKDEEEQPENGDKNEENEAIEKEETKQEETVGDEELEESDKDEGSDESDKDEGSEESDNDVESEEENESDDDNSSEMLQEEEDDNIPNKKPKFESNDVVEGKTIFIKNVPFSATNEDLKECMKQFGPVYYALICIDKYTEHSKGTAFVKFLNAEDAEKALSAGTELTLMGNILDCHKALGRNEVKQKSDEKKNDKTIKKDSRNLYLVKEGVVLAGSKAAEGVSASDMARRLQLEQYKTQMLRNLNMFVSRERIVVHNLPPNWDDKKFRTLIQNNSPKNSVIREARIMRDLKNVDAAGVGKSKEFGFVTFARHEDALSTLRTLNNNPNIFSINKRPIIAFSIENKTMIKAKQKRLEKSKLKNPKCKNYNPDAVKKNEEKKNNHAVEEERKNYVGVVAKPGVQKMRSRYNLKTQAKLHHENLKKEKKKKKMSKKTLKEKKQEFTKQPQQKINKKKQNNDNFAKLVSDYRKKLLAPPEVNKTKWYLQQ